jgi:molybdenum cofactor biosynthesis enzyme MoaA
VSSSGAIYPCLLRNLKIDAFDSIKAGKESTKEVLMRAIDVKPQFGNPDEVGPEMSEIGG